MQDPTDCTAEAQPLKGEEGAEGQPPPPGKKKGCWGGLGFSQLSNWRTAGFFLSLFLCLTVVFAFSFIIPCPVRPVYLRTWNRTFPQAATYDFLAITDANKDKVLDVLFVLKASEGSQNMTCLNQSLPTPCVFMSAVAGTNGDTLWERPLAPEFHWAQCGLEGLGLESKGCLLSHADQLTAINKHNGEILWQQMQPPNLNSKLPVLTVPDLDGDGVSDVVLIGTALAQTRLVVLSGKTGTQIGSEVVLDSGEVARHLLHTTAKGSHYILLQKDSGLYGQALWKIAAQAKAGSETNLKKDKGWEEKTSADSGDVLLYKSDSLQHVLRTAKGSSTSNLLLVTEGSVELISGDSLQSLWRTNTSRVLRWSHAPLPCLSQSHPTPPHPHSAIPLTATLSVGKGLCEPSFGHFNKDGTPDVVIEEEFANGTKRVMILDGSTGGVLWEVHLLLRPNTPKPCSVNTINSFSVFVLWGEMLSETNSSISSSNKRFSYMLHPQYYNVLLEKSSIIDHIIAFKATLLERGRHASYIMLTGPQGEGLEGVVTLTKRKLKEDIPESRIMAEDIKAKLETYRTAPFDARFPNQNQTRNCWQNYLDYHRCQKALTDKGVDVAPCDWYKRVYKSLCPLSWVSVCSYEDVSISHSYYQIQLKSELCAMLRLKQLVQ
ncbi:hypothetical protein JZ751_026282 [Albula glossodonta]|uniref:Cytochrome c oxidase subunit 6B1 n=1 Tax=Albula glossodonta TaxID=121402 RepID=A0A8T2PCI5_9TELE|nr:hypothetical protein JZ751_026282 [Albula glossodonta]